MAGFRPKITLVFDDATTGVVDAANTGWLLANAPVGIPPNFYTTGHDAANADDVTNGSIVPCGQLFIHRTANPAHSNDQFYFYRGTLEFNLSAYAGKTVASASIWLDQESFDLDNEFNVTIVNGDDLGATIVAADYGDLLNETTSYGSVPTGSGSVDSWLEIALNATGLTQVQAALGSTIRFGVRSDRDIASTNPVPTCGSADVGEYMTFYGVDSPSSLLGRSYGYIIG